MLAHFALINSEILDSRGIFGTGTTTVLSWMIGWLYFFYNSVVVPARKRSSNTYKISRALRYELILLLGQLFVLAVGAGAFSRGYYGWMNGKECLFQVRDSSGLYLYK